MMSKQAIDTKGTNCSVIRGQELICWLGLIKFITLLKHCIHLNIRQLRIFPMR